MSEVRAFFRYCPSCGRRFHIKLVGKALIELDRQSVERKTVVSGANALTGVSRSSSSFGAPQAPVLTVSTAMIIDIEKFSYSYRCGHCGHAWSETRTEQVREG